MVLGQGNAWCCFHGRPFRNLRVVVLPIPPRQYDGHGLGTSLGEAEGTHRALRNDRSVAAHGRNARDSDARPVLW